MVTAKFVRSDNAGENYIPTGIDLSVC